MIETAVIIPVYNGEPYIGEALRSVLAQTRPAARILVLDDNSSDKTRTIAEGFGRSVEILFDGTNLGPGARRNQGVEEAATEYVAFLDADDVWTPDHLEKTAGLLDRFPEAVLAFGRAEFFGEREGVWCESLPESGRPADLFLRQMRNHLVLPSTMVVRRSAYLAVGGFDTPEDRHGGKRLLADDFDFVTRLALHGPFVPCPDTTVRYRWHAEQASVNRVPQVVMSFRYRLRILERLRADPTLSHLSAAAAERSQMCWAECVEREWARRNLPGLRMLVRFGLRQPLFRPATWRYVPRSLAGGLRSVDG